MEEKKIQRTTAAKPETVRKRLRVMLRLLGLGFRVSGSGFRVETCDREHVLVVVEDVVEDRERLHVTLPRTVPASVLALPRTVPASVHDSAQNRTSASADVGSVCSDLRPVQRA
eukprot:3769430-Rhodomonas_salina.1